MKDLTIRISGAISIGEGDIAIHGQVRQAAQAGYQIIILDMEGVTYLDSSSVGELAASVATAKSHGAELALTKLGDRVRRTLATMAFLDIFQVYDSNEDAKQIMRGRFAKRDREEA